MGSSPIGVTKILRIRADGVLAGLITQRSQVRVLHPLPTFILRIALSLRLTAGLLILAQSIEVRILEG